MIVIFNPISSARAELVRTSATSTGESRWTWTVAYGGRRVQGGECTSHTGAAGALEIATMVSADALIGKSVPQDAIRALCAEL